MKDRRGNRIALVLVAAAVGLVVASALFDLPKRLLASERIAALAPQIRASAAEFDLDPYLVAAVVDAESSGRVDAVSRVGALGLMQLKLETARERARLLGIVRVDESALLSDPALNLRLGCAYLRHLLDRFGDEDPRPALIAYNAGPSKVAKWFDEAGGFEPWLAAQDAAAPAQPGSVRHYARKILATQERFRARALLGEPVD
ncbi:MAG: lytic transglycosylase domain-containing protein [Planctomycetota bacterium]